MAMVNVDPRAVLTLRVPSTREDSLAILEVLKEMHDEVGRAPLNEHKAWVTISHVIQSENAKVIEVNGSIVATYGLYKDSWWYSDEEALFSMWFYVTKEYRNGRATRMLFEDIADRVEDESICAYVHIYDGGNALASKIRKVAEEVGFLPTGRVVAFAPKGG